MRTITLIRRSTFVQVRAITRVRIVGLVLMQNARTRRTFEIMPLTSTETEGEKDGKKGEAFHRRIS